MLKVGDEMEGMMARYDVIYMSDKVTLAPHFCRKWSKNGGCYGANQDISTLPIFIGENNIS